MIDYNELSKIDFIELVRLRKYIESEIFVRTMKSIDSMPEKTIKNIFQK